MGDTTGTWTETRSDRVGQRPRPVRGSGRPCGSPAGRHGSRSPARSSPVEAPEESFLPTFPKEGALLSPEGWRWAEPGPSTGMSHPVIPVCFRGAPASSGPGEALPGPPSPGRSIRSESPALGTRPSAGCSGNWGDSSMGAIATATESPTRGCRCHWSP